MRTVRENYGFNKPLGELGIEIEVEGDKKFPNPPVDWIITTDGSLRGYSAEYVSAAPIQVDFVHKHLAGLQACIKEAGVRINKSFRAGVHIHVNVCELNISEVANFALLYYIFDHAFARFCGSNREGNLFCLRAEDAEAPLFFLQRALTTEQFEGFQTDGIRYGAVNFASISRHGSLEFRTMETPLDFLVIEDWAKILYSLREYALKHNRDTYGDTFSLLGPEAFLEQIIGKELATKIVYDDFVKDTVASMRRVQHLFYVG